ncbi:ATP-binding protein [Gluconobacter oxydans]|uniref:ATP-binding protein n=1 Tax=Gluconobacter oxydans TaxID=442 RepID=UPI001CD842BB|nr:ATP-binding protein [Gluconobacter oxydans]
MTHISFPQYLYRALPKTIYGQMVAILISSLLITLFIVAFLLNALRPAIPPLPEGPWPSALAIETGIRAIRAVPVSERETMSRGFSTPDLRFQVNAAFPCLPRPMDHEGELLRRILQSHLPADKETLQVFNCAEYGEKEKTTNVFLPRDGIHLSIRSGINFQMAQIMHMTLPITVPFISLLVMTGALSIWSIWRVNRPLSTLASYAETLGYDSASSPIKEQGPREVRHVIRAFNRMQTRISAAASERTRMLMSVSHDLRTPLTRLSMRVEMGGEDAASEAMRHDLNLMKQMLNGALSFLKGQRDVEPLETVELGSLIESLCEEFSAVGRDVQYQGAMRLPCFCEPVSIARAISNLVENGLKYGQQTRVDAWSSDGQIFIEVQDRGPGIPESMRQAMLQPFARMDPARGSDGSLGLGLSIVHDIIARHHGTIEFRDAQPSGLIVRLILPERLKAPQRTAPSKPAFSVHPSSSSYPQS